MASSVIDGNSGNSENGDELQQQQRVDLATLVDFAAIRAHFRPLLPNPQRRDTIYKNALRLEKDRSSTKEQLQRFIIGITPALRDLADLCGMEAPLPSEVNKNLAPVVIERAEPIEQQFSKLTEEIAQYRVDINKYQVDFNTFQIDIKNKFDFLKELKEQTTAQPALSAPQYRQVAKNANVRRDFWQQQRQKVELSNVSEKITESEHFRAEKHHLHNKITFTVKEGVIDTNQDLNRQMKSVDDETMGLLKVGVDDIRRHIRNNERQTITWFMAETEKVSAVIRAVKAESSRPNNRLKVTLPISKVRNPRFVEITSHSHLIKDMFRENDRELNGEELKEVKEKFRQEIINLNFKHHTEEEREEVHIKHFFMRNYFSHRLRKSLRVPRVVVGLTPKMFFEVMHDPDNRVLRFENERHEVKRFLDWTQCKVCLGFGHRHEEDPNSKVKCPIGRLSCGHCGRNHATHTCTHKDDPDELFCVNCWQADPELKRKNPSQFTSQEWARCNHSAFNTLKCRTKIRHLATKAAEQTCD